VNENFFTQKLGRLPMWAWIGAGVGVLLIFNSFFSRSNNNQPASTSDNAEMAESEEAPTFTLPPVNGSSTGDTMAPGGPSTAPTSAGNGSGTSGRSGRNSPRQRRPQARALYTAQRGDRIYVVPKRSSNA
jgi:hypothetical protein